MAQRGRKMTMASVEKQIAEQIEQIENAENRLEKFRNRLADLETKRAEMLSNPEVRERELERAESVLAELRQTLDDVKPGSATAQKLEAQIADTEAEIETLS